MKKILITQSNYIPWKGYFDAINSVDTFIVYDEMQYTKRDWRNRNKIKTAQGTNWLSIPVQVKQKFHQKINETLISEPGWNKKHWQTISHNYAKSEFFHAYKDQVEKLYLDCNQTNLTEVNVYFIKWVCNILGIETEILRSKDFELRGDKTEKLLNLCLDVNGTDYYSGPSAQAYMDESSFHKNNVNVHWLDYNSYPEYTQQYGAFEHGVSILDLIFNEGTKALDYMKSFNVSQASK